MEAGSLRFPGVGGPNVPAQTMLRGGAPPRVCHSLIPEARVAYFCNLRITDQTSCSERS
jgi:hypothetical protein